MTGTPDFAPPENGKTPSPGGRISEYGFPALASTDLVSCLAQTVLESLEDMERECGLKKMSAWSDDRMHGESQILFAEIAALKARLKEIAAGIY